MWHFVFCKRSNEASWVITSIILKMLFLLKKIKVCLSSPAKKWSASLFLQKKIKCVMLIVSFVYVLNAFIKWLFSLCLSNKPFPTDSDWLVCV
jgi:hypothetical protein